MLRTDIITVQPLRFRYGKFHGLFHFSRQNKVGIRRHAQTDNIFQRAGHIGSGQPQVTQHLTGRPVFVEDETEQYMFCSYIIMRHPLRSGAGIPKNLFRVVCKTIIHAHLPPYVSCIM